jgi:hypothetical protein
MPFKAIIAWNCVRDFQRGTISGILSPNQCRREVAAHKEDSLSL